MPFLDSISAVHTEYSTMMATHNDCITQYCTIYSHELTSVHTSHITIIISPGSITVGFSLILW